MLVFEQRSIGVDSRGREITLPNLRLLRGCRLSVHNSGPGALTVSLAEECLDGTLAAIEIKGPPGPHRPDDTIAYDLPGVAALRLTVTLAWDEPATLGPWVEAEPDPSEVRADILGAATLTLLQPIMTAAARANAVRYVPPKAVLSISGRSYDDRLGLRKAQATRPLRVYTEPGQAAAEVAYGACSVDDVDIDPRRRSEFLDMLCDLTGPQAQKTAIRERVKAVASRPL